MEVLSYERTTQPADMIHVRTSILLQQIGKDIKVQSKRENDWIEEAGELQKFENKSNHFG
jgi:hypothetical protein